MFFINQSLNFYICDNVKLPNCVGIVPETCFPLIELQRHKEKKLNFNKCIHL